AGGIDAPDAASRGARSRNACLNHAGVDAELLAAESQTGARGVLRVVVRAVGKAPRDPAHASPRNGRCGRRVQRVRRRGDRLPRHQLSKHSEARWTHANLEVACLTVERRGAEIDIDGEHTVFDDNSVARDVATDLCAAAGGVEELELEVERTVRRNTLLRELALV